MGDNGGFLSGGQILFILFLFSLFFSVLDFLIEIGLPH
jgi:hypothetical protein